MPNRDTATSAQKCKNTGKYKLGGHLGPAKLSPQGAPEGVFWGPSGRLSRDPRGSQKGSKWDPQNAPNLRERFQKALELEPQALLEPLSFLSGFGGPPLGPPFGAL